MSNPWIIWIPLVGVYTVGAIADDIHAREGKRTIFRWLLLGGQILTYVISIISSIASIASLGSLFSSFENFDYYGENYWGGLSNYSIVSTLLGGPASLLSLAVYVITVIALYYIYKCYKPESATAYTVVSVIFPFMQSIFPFTLRNRQPHWLNPPPYYGGTPSGFAPGPGTMPGGYPPPPNGFSGENANPGGYQYAPPPQGFTPPPSQEFGQAPYGAYPPGSGQGPQTPPPPSQEPFGDDPNRL
jgi:uncharacterized membrane protein YuzA (DUF378 family)